MNIIICIMVCFIPFGVCHADGLLKLDVSVEQSGCDVTLKANIENISNKSITVMNISLPWEIGPFAMIFSVRPFDYRVDDVKPVFIIRDKDSRTVINAGESVSGRVNLNKRAPSLETALVQSDAALFWTYKLFVPDKNDFEKFAGAIILKKCSVVR